MTTHLGDFFSQRQEIGNPGLPLMSVTMNDSLVLRDDLDRRTESALRPDQHLLVKKGDIAYNMMRMWQGACGLASSDGIVSLRFLSACAPETTALEIALASWSTMATATRAGSLFLPTPAKTAPKNDAIAIGTTKLTMTERRSEKKSCRSFRTIARSGVMSINRAGSFPSA